MGLPAVFQVRQTPAMNPVTRRAFVTRTATAAGAAALARESIASANAAPTPTPQRPMDPNQTLRIGLIGCGWYGMVDVDAAFKIGGVEVTAICDADSEHLEQSAKKIEERQKRRPQTFKRYEDLLQVSALDVVIIATPPHWHALQLIAALDRGLDVYCEKPLAYDVREAQAMVAAVKRSGRIVQIGHQRRQSPAFQQVRDHLRAGNAGRIVCAEANIHYTAGTKDPTPVPPPSSLDWNLWCGPGPLVPYSLQTGHFNWRLEEKSGHGHLVDWGIHLIDAARFILGEGAPRTVSASGGLYALRGRITTPDVLEAYFEFATCPLTWRHRIWGAEEYSPEISNGITFYGEKQTIFVTDDRWTVIPHGQGKDRQTHEAKADMGARHMEDFLQAVRARRAPACPIEEAFPSTLAVKLAMIAQATGTRLTWDAKAGTIAGNKEAARRLKRAYRAPWHHPYHG